MLGLSSVVQISFSAREDAPLFPYDVLTFLARSGSLPFNCDRGYTPSSNHDDERFHHSLTPPHFAVVVEKQLPPPQTQLFLDTLYPPVPPDQKRMAGSRLPHLRLPFFNNFTYLDTRKSPFFGRETAPCSYLFFYFGCGCEIIILLLSTSPTMFLYNRYKRISS